MAEPTPLELLQLEGIKAHQLQMQHASNGAQLLANSHVQLTNTLHYKGMQDLDNISQTEGLGTRMVMGPHPYYGSPDGKPIS